MVNKISRNPTVAKIDLSENAKLLVDHEFSQTVGLQKNLPTKTVAFIVYWYRFITNIAILKKFINFCTENIYPNYINGILYSKTGYYSPFGRLVPTCLLYLVRHTCIEKVFSAMTNWGRSVTSKGPEKRMKRHLVAKMLLFLLIENWPDYHKTGNDTRIRAHTYCAYKYVVSVLFLGKSTCSINYNTDWMLITFWGKR